MSLKRICIYIFCFCFSFDIKKWHICQFWHISLIISDVWADRYTLSKLYLPACLSDLSANVAVDEMATSIQRLACIDNRGLLE